MSITEVQLSQWTQSRGVLLGLLARYPYGDEGEAEYLTDAIQLFYFVLGVPRYNIGDPTVKDYVKEEIKDVYDHEDKAEKKRQVKYYRVAEDKGLYRIILRLITHLMTPPDVDEFPSVDHILGDLEMLESALKSYAQFPVDKGYNDMLENCRSILKEEFTVYTPLKEEDYCTCLICGKPVILVENEDV